MPTKVALLCPIAESIPPDVFKHTIAMVSYATGNDCQITQVGTTERMLIHSARNALALGFKATDCEWAFWMDADMILPANTIVQLLKTAKEKDAKFVTGVYYQRLGQHLPVLWRKDPVLMDGTLAPLQEGTKKDGREAYLHHFIVPTGTAPIRADVCGFGCVLMHRELVEKIPYPYFKTISDDCSEDFYFCIEAKKAGFELWADPSLELGHIGKPPAITKRDCMLKAEDLKEVQL